MRMNRLPWVDALRGIAVLLVLGRHFPVEFISLPHPLLKPLQIWKQVGWTGVDLFFVISGFLISGLLFREYQKTNRLNMMRFFIRRAIRILVPFYSFLILSLPLRFEYAHVRNLCVEFFFLQGYLHPWVMWNHTWTLAIEEHFYLFLGLLMFYLSGQKKQDPFRLIIPIWVLLAVFCLLLRIGTPYDSYHVLFNSHLRFDALFFGVLLSYLYHFHFDRLKQATTRFRYAIATAVVFAFLPVFFFRVGSEPWMTRFGLTGVYLAGGGLLALCLFATAKPPQFLISIGRISYSTYLWHMAVRKIVLLVWGSRGFSVADAWIVGGIYAALALLAGWLSYRMIEKPSLIWRDKQFA